jgi:sigma-E factor negative regulatory protein RseB
MTDELLGHHPLRRAAQRFVLVAGAGALGAAVCATIVFALGSGGSGAGRGTSPGPRVPSPRPLGAEESTAATLLRDAATSSAGVRFRGRKIFGSWTSLGTTSVLADVRHEPGQGTTVRVTSAGAGADAEQLAPDGAPRLDQPDGALVRILTSHYRVGIGQPAVCVGRAATVVEAVDLTSGRLAGRFWIDEATGILLRHEVYDAAGRQVWMSAYLDLDIDPATAPPTPVTPSHRATPDAGPPADTPAVQAARLRSAGWTVPPALPGGLELVTAGDVRVGGGHAVQLTYLDGLYGASVFAEHGRLDADALHGFKRTRLGDANVWARGGLYRQYVWSGGDTVYTLVTDAPDNVVSGTVGTLPHGAPPPDVLSRMGRGIDRVGSWINPFQ